MFAHETQTLDHQKYVMDKDTFVAIGVIVTAAIGLLNLSYSFRHNRRASYVGSVTATRLKWIGEVRDMLAQFGALAIAYSRTTAGAAQERLFQRLTQCRITLRLQLAPHMADLDLHFQTEIESLYAALPTITAADTAKRVEQIIEVGQRFLWEEWMKVKRETIQGDPYDSLSNKIEKWFGA